MALDHALAAMGSPGEGVVRFYGWAAPTVSFGRNEPADGLYDDAEAARHGIDFVRRPTGGRAVLHDAELTYAVVVGDRMPGGPRKLYARIHEALARGLARLGAEVSVAGRGDALPPNAGPCFRVPASGEVVARGRKLVGSAQVRLGGALLQHGSIILEGDQSILAVLRKEREGARKSEEAASIASAATLRSLIGAVVPDTLIAALAEAFRLELGGSWRTGRYHERELDEADRLERERYSDPGWTWRR